MRRPATLLSTVVSRLRRRAWGSSEARSGPLPPTFPNVPYMLPFTLSQAISVRARDQLHSHAAISEPIAFVISGPPTHEALA